MKNHAHEMIYIQIKIPNPVLI